MNLLSILNLIGLNLRPVELKFIYQDLECLLSIGILSWIELSQIIDCIRVHTSYELYFLSNDWICEIKVFTTRRYYELPHLVFTEVLQNLKMEIHAHLISSNVNSFDCCRLNFVSLFLILLHFKHVSSPEGSLTWAIFSRFFIYRHPQVLTFAHIIGVSNV